MESGERSLASGLWRVQWQGAEWTVDGGEWFVKSVEEGEQKVV